MRLELSLVCALMITTVVACGEKGSSDGAEGGTGGTAGTASTGGGGNPLTITKAWTFDTDIEGFIIQDSSGASGVTPLPKADIMLSHNADEGEPDPGSLQMNIPFDAASQYVSTGVNLDVGADLTGKKLKAKVKVLSGYGTEEDLMMAPANAKLYVKTGASYVYGSASVSNITAIGVWATLDFDPEFPGYQAEGDYDITDVREIGLQLDTNSASKSATDAVVVIDNINY